MARLIYSAIASLDGYVEDCAGRFDWAAPDEEVHTFVNELERPVGTYLYGRRMYETMRYWQTAPTDASSPASTADYARIWQAADKIVYSRTVSDVPEPRTRVEPAYDAEAIRRRTAASDADLSIGGAELAARALRDGLVDVLQLLAVPVIVGGGKAWLPDGLRLDLTLQQCRRFTNGTAFLQYHIAR